MLYGIYLFVAALLIYGGQTQECIRCPNGFIHLPKENKCYKVFPILVTWDEAFNICKQLGAHLPDIYVAGTNAALRIAFTPVKGLCPDSYYKGSSFWTAGRSLCKKSAPFTWVTGKGNLFSITYTNWLKGQPDKDEKNDKCIYIVDDGTELYGWNDDKCVNKHCAICQIDI